MADAGRHQGGHGGKVGPGTSPVLQDRPAEPLDTGQPELSLGGLWQWEFAWCINLLCPVAFRTLSWYKPWTHAHVVHFGIGEGGKRSLKPMVVLQKVQA